MFQLIIIIIFISLIIYLEYFSTKEGKWIEQNKDYDISDNHKVNKLVLNTFLKTDQIYLNENESLLIIFYNSSSIEENNWFLDVYQEEKLIYTFNNPLRLQFTTQDINYTHYLQKNVYYKFLLRSNNYIDSKSFKFLNYKDMEIKKENSKIFTPSYYNDTQLKKNFINYCYQIIKEMKTKKWFLKTFIDSKTYNSIPGNIYANKIKTIIQKNQNCILVCTNKFKSINVKHDIEVNTSLDSFNWSPKNNSYISHLIIENEIDNNEIKIYERCNEIISKSILIPCRLLIFEYF